MIIWMTVNADRETNSSLARIFLDRYLKIVPEYSFGLGKKELLPDKDLK